MKSKLLLIATVSTLLSLSIPARAEGGKPEIADYGSIRRTRRHLSGRCRQVDGFAGK